MKEKAKMNKKTISEIERLVAQLSREDKSDVLMFLRMRMFALLCKCDPIFFHEWINFHPWEKRLRYIRVRFFAFVESMKG